MWVELGHSNFLYIPAVSNIVTNGNGMGIKNVFKRSMCLSLFVVSSLLSTALLLYGAVTIGLLLWGKPILYLDMVCYKFILYVSVEIDPFRCDQTSVN